MHIQKMVCIVYIRTEQCLSVYQGSKKWSWENAWNIFRDNLVKIEMKNN